VLLAQKELFQLGKHDLCTDKVCGIVAPNGTRTAYKADESPQRCDERIRRKILDHLQMSSLRGKADKDGDIALVGCLISGHCLMIEWPTIIHSNRPVPLP